MDFSHFLQLQGQRVEPTRRVDFQGNFDILSEMRLSGVVEYLKWGMSERYL